MKRCIIIFAYLFVANYLFSQCVNPTPSNPGSGTGLHYVSFMDIAHSTPIEEGFTKESDSVGLTITNAIRGKWDTLMLIISTPTCAGLCPQNVGVWVDWNQNGIFELFSNEVIYKQKRVGFSADTLIMPLSIPLDAALGATTMRIGVKNSGAPALAPCTGATQGDFEDYILNVVDSNMRIDSIITSQITDVCYMPGNKTKEVVKIAITATYSINPLRVDTIICTTTGSTNPLLDLDNAVLYYTGINPVFSTSNLFGNQIANPNGMMMFTDTQTLAISGTHYFWLTYDINASATVGNSLDATCEKFVLDSSGVPFNIIPDVTSPAGSSFISDEAPLLYTKRVKNWYFGDSAGIEFSCTFPTALIDGVTRKYFVSNPLEGTTAMSDMNGDLLFYAQGEHVWNKNHQMMSNGTALSSTFSSLQGPLAFPVPGSDSLYYLFNIDASAGGAGSGRGLTYSIIDMSLNGGLGDIILSTLNTTLMTGLVERITAVQHCNGIDYWVIVFENGDFHSYLATANGVAAPVTSTAVISVMHDVGSQLKASPTGKNLAMSHKIAQTGLPIIMTISSQFLFDFDCSTGIVCNPLTLSTDTGANYGASFSPDGSKLYFTDGGSLLQYDINASDIAMSKTTMTGLGIFLGLQIGPDGKIYVSKGESNYLGVIHNPNIAGVSSNFENNAISLSGKLGGLSLPTFVESWFRDTSYIEPVIVAAFNNNTVCNGDTTQFINTSTFYTGCPRFKWYFGDPVSGINDSSDLQDPKHLFTRGGIYNVTLVLKDQCQSQTIQKQVLVIGDTSYILPDTSICAGMFIQIGIDSAVGVNYNWTPSSNLTDPSLSNPFANPLDTTQYELLASIVGCQDTIMQTINVIPIAFAEAGNNMDICNGSSIILDGSNSNGYSSFAWTLGGTIIDTNSIITSIMPNQSGIYVLNVVNSFCGAGSDSVLINVFDTPTVDLGADTIICAAQNQTMQLNVTSQDAFTSILWSTSETSNNITVSQEGQYWVELNSSVCLITLRDSIEIDAECPKLFIPNSFSPNGDGENDMFAIRGEGISTIEIKIYDRWGKKVFESLDSGFNWDGTHNQKLVNAGAYVYRIIVHFQNGSDMTNNGNITLIR